MGSPVLRSAQPQSQPHSAVLEKQWLAQQAGCGEQQRRLSSYDSRQQLASILRQNLQLAWEPAREVGPE